MSQEKIQDHAFVIDTLAHLLDHISRTDEQETGNQEILLSLISKELRHRSELLLKT